MAQTRRGAGEEWPVRRSAADLAGGSGRYNRDQERLKRGQERIQDYFFRLQERPRALQEVFKRVSEGFRVEDTIRTPFWNHFGGQKRDPGTSKTIKILAKVVKNQGFAILSLDRFRTSILGPSRAHFERVFGAQAIKNRSLR